MLIRLTHTQVTNNWSEIKDHLRCALVPQMEVGEPTLAKILQGLLAETSHAWILYDIVEEKAVVYAMAVTCFSTELATDTKNLLIYSLSGYRSVPEPAWKQALKDIKAFAKANGCYKVIAFTQLKRIIDIAKLLDGDVSTTLISWEV